MVTRRQLARSVPSRFGARQIQGKSIVVRRREKEEEAKFLSNLNQSISSLDQVSNIKDLNNSASLLKNQLGGLSPTLRNKANSLIDNKVNSIRNTVNKKISNLKNDINQWKVLESKADRKSKDAKKEGDLDRFADQRGREERYKVRIEEANKIISRLTAGEILEGSKIDKFISDVSRQAEKKVEAKLKRKAFESKIIKLDDNKTETVLNQIANKYKSTPDNKTIQKEFKKAGITLTREQTIQAFNVLFDVEKERKKQKALIKQTATQQISILKDFSVPDTTFNYQQSKKPSLFVEALAKKGDLRAKQFKSYQELNPQNKVLVANYITINSLKTNLPSIKEIQTPKLILEKALSTVGKEKVPAELRSLIKDVLSPTDVKSINFLRGLTDKELRTAIVKNDSTVLNKIDKSFGSYNKYITSVEKVNVKALDKLIVDLSKGKDKLIQDRIKERRTLKDLPIISSVKFLTELAIMNAREKVIKDKKKNNQLVTLEEYKQYRDSINDVLGLKRAKLPATYKGKKGIALIGSYIKFLGKTNVEAFKEIKRDVDFILGVTVRTGKFSLKTLETLGKDVGVSLSQVIKSMPTNERKKLLEYTGQQLKPISTFGTNTKKFITWAYKNPGLFSLAVAGIVSATGFAISKEFRKNPEKAMGFVLSLFLDEILLKAGIKVAKVTKATFSPAVIRLADVYEDSASVRVKAQTLKDLEGTKLNIFSATKTDVDKLFKQTGSGISRTEFNKLLLDMKKNPSKYFGSNFKIKKIDDVFKGTDKRIIVEAIKRNNGFISGSGALKLQLKSFRKIGDIDSVVLNAKKVAKQIVDQLNTKSVFGKIKKGTRYKIKPKGLTYTIWDSGISGTRKYSTKYDIGDIVDLKKWEADFGKKLSKADLRKIDGVNVLKAEVQIPKKVELTSTLAGAKRFDKEIKDLKIFFKQNKAIVKPKEWNGFKKLVTKKADILRVRPIDVGSARKYDWSKQFLGDIKIPFSKSGSVERNIVKRLKKLGMKQSDINKAVNTLAPADMYFSPNVIYSYYLFDSKGKIPKKAGVLFARNIEVAKYPPSIQKRMKILEKLTGKQRAKLVNDMRRYRLANPDKVFIGQKGIQDLNGELELLLPEFSKLIKKKNFITREVYIPSIEKFVKAQEVVIGKKPNQKLLKELIKEFQSKLKKGYKFVDMKKDISKYLKTKGKLIKELALPSKKDQQAIRKTLDGLDDQIDLIRKSDLSKTAKSNELRRLRNIRKSFRKPKTALKLAIVRRVVNSAIRRSRKLVRPTKRVIKRVRVRKPVKRAKVTKRVTTRKVKPRKRVVKRKVTRKVERAKRPVKRVTRPVRKVTRVVGRVRPPKRPPKRVPKIIRPGLSWDKKLKKGEVLIVNARVRIKGKTKEIAFKTTPNRALKKVTKLIDNTTARSFELKIIGVATGKDIKKPNLTKFRLKKSKGSKVLKLVEKTKYTIDTKGEKKGLKLGKALKKNTRVTKRKDVKLRLNKKKNKKIAKKRKVKSRKTKSKKRK